MTHMRIAEVVGWEMGGLSDISEEVQKYYLT
jgi:hypothetical protein